MSDTDAETKRAIRLGLECPACGCVDLKTTHTERLRRCTRRRKVCRHCGKRIVSTERLHPQAVQFNNGEEEMQPGNQGTENREW